MFNIKFPTLDIGDYVLREHQDRDLQNFFDYYTDPKVNEYILAEIPKTIEDARYELKYWKNVFYNGQGLYFTIARKSDDKMIGSIGLTTYNQYHNRIELSYDMAQKFWGKGIMRKATQKLVGFAFEVLKINRIEAICSTFNEPSIRLLQRCGFNYEGCLKQHRFHRGKYVDVYSFSIIRQDYLANPEKYQN